MKFALVDGERREARHGLSGTCPLYGHAMIAKCGEHRVHHWAHRANCSCDHWWEPETAWHRDWKDRFPEDWQEVIHQSDGKKHYADVETASGKVIEFQHSHLPRGEREAREIFYQNMVWVVDGLRRARDRPRFFEALKRASIVKAKPLTLALRSNGGALLRDWADSRKPVFFDFGDDDLEDDSEPGDLPAGVGSALWRLDPHSLHLSPILKTSFLNTCLKGLPSFKGMSVPPVPPDSRPEWVREFWAGKKRTRRS